jgi:hypothetical protein
LQDLGSANSSRSDQQRHNRQQPASIPEPPFWAIPIPEIWPPIAAQIQPLWRVPVR